jgi:sulfite reductase beta subunit
MSEEKIWGKWGLLHYDKMLPPVIKKNYGKWKYHDFLKPGVLKHVSDSGDEIITVRVGMPKFVAGDTVRKVCDIADKFCEGYLRFTSRSSLEFLISKKENVEPLIKEVKKVLKFPIGGVGNTMQSILQCTGWMHCQTPATDGPGIANALYNEFYDLFFRTDLPAHLKMGVVSCLNMCGSTHACDVGIIGVHRTVPKVIDEEVAKCEIPTLIRSCPTYAIKPKILTSGSSAKPIRSISIDPKKCMYCGICYIVCPGTPLADADHDGVSIWVGGKTSNTRNGPMLSRLVIPYIPNNPPKWPEVVEKVRIIVDAWMNNAQKDERVGEWIERIGWERFFKITEIPFTADLIDDFVFSIPTWRSTTQFKW